MPVTTSEEPGYLGTRAHRHPGCWVCAPGRGGGLGIHFRVGDDGAVEGAFLCSEEYTGYPGLLHGGVISSLLDGAMTNCLMAMGKPGLTARLDVRYLKPVRTGCEVTVAGWWEKSRGSLHFLQAVMAQDGDVVARAEGRFMEYPDPEGPDGRGRQE